MMKTKHWMRTLVICCSALLFSRMMWADDLRIQSFDRTGMVTFNELTTATTYRIDWANSPTGTWHTGSPGVTGLVARGFGTNSAMLGINATNSFFQLVASVTNAPFFLVVDISGGVAAPNFPVSTMMAVPAGGWTDDYKTTKIVFRRIPAGTFTMGSPTNELGRYIDETQHQVTLSQDFYIGVFQVTQKQWERIMGNWPSYFTNPVYCSKRPVETVSYNDIRGASLGANWPATNTVDSSSFMGVLRAKTGKAFDLPTESQWEYACRAGTLTALNNGSNFVTGTQDPGMDQVGRYYFNGGSAYAKNGNATVGTAEVGSYLANAWGLYDMHGNVFEACLDWYDTYPGDVIDPRGAASGSARVTRGGSWDDYAANCASAYRTHGYPSNGGLRAGFRAVVPH